MSKVVQRSGNKLTSMLINFLSFIDLIFGLRSIGIILFALLPANLTLIGSLKISIGSVDKISPTFLFLSCMIPILIVFLLIRNKHKEWYLTKDWLITRSILNTFAILLFSTIICWISGIINSRYTFEIPDALLSSPYIFLKAFNALEWIKSTAIIESFLLAVASLVISSTLFLTVMTGNANLPLLPSVEFVNSLKEIKVNIRQLQQDNIWKECYTSAKDFDKLIDSSGDIAKALNKSSNLNFFAKESLKSTEKDIGQFILALKDIQNNCNDKSIFKKWKKYFDNHSDDKDLAYINKIKKMKVGI